ncbi:enolase C-terminal domain-like protein [Streptomyces sp. DW26H14]|uniref:enolase C-terminal domain-like protein n=1 Tax=Streptomyces sp. DW26H14 TaxID=3435395 RepID=UPI00403E1682
MNAAAPAAAAAPTGDGDADMIRHIEIRVCRGDSAADDVRASSALPGGSRPPFVVLTLETGDGVTGTSFAFSTFNPRAAGEAMVPVKQFFLGRDVFERERAQYDFRRFDRSWTLSPIYAYGPFDNASWDIIGKKTGRSVSRLLGRARDTVPVYVSSMFLPQGEDAYVAQAREAKAAGFHGYKIHPGGRLDEDLAVYAAVRKEVGPDFALMVDPVGAYTYAEALTAGRALEQLGYRWLEEPVHDVDWLSQQKLTAALDIPIIGTETLAGGHRGTSQAIAQGLVDAVRTDVSWRGGITDVMKTASLADAFGMRCELHTCVYHALDLVNLQCVSALTNCTYLELLYPLTDNDFGLAHGIDIVDGHATVPDAPGLGIAYDWDFIDDRTMAIL